MTTPHLHVLGIAPGESAGWCLITVPRLCIFGSQPSEVIERDYGEFHGDDIAQAISIARLAREVQSLDYKTGPAVVIEGADSPVSAMLRLLRHQGQLGDSTITAREWPAISDEQLKRARMWTGSPLINDAHSQVIAALRRARQSGDFAHELWPYPPNGQA